MIVYNMFYLLKHVKYKSTEKIKNLRPADRYFTQIRKSIQATSED